MNVRLGALGAVLAAYAALAATLFHVDVEHRNLEFFCAATVLFAVAVALLAGIRLPARHVAGLIIAVGALLQLIALTHSPLTSDDAYRYLWDGKVQLSGIDPYHYAPSAPQLEHLRDSQLFGPSSTCAHSIPGSCSAINRPTVHTIYPPVAEAVFAFGRLVSFGGGLLAFQILAALGAVAITVLLARRALDRGNALWPVALWAWCPVVVSEFGNNAHIDWLGVLLSVLALQARRSVVAAGLAGAAIASKLYPILLLPSLMRRRPWLVPLTALGVVVLVYVPHVLAVGRAVIGYLPGYLHEEGYNSGSRLLLLGTVLPHPADTIVGVALLAGVALWAWRRSDPHAPEQTATIMAGAAFLVATPQYGWYAPFLIALAVLSARYEWVVLGLAPSLGYLVHGDLTHSGTVNSLIYLGGALGTGIAWWARVTLGHRSARTARPIPATTAVE